MTYILVALMYLDGQLQMRVIEHESRNACEVQARAVELQFQQATVQCIAVSGQPT